MSIEAVEIGRAEEKGATEHFSDDQVKHGEKALGMVGDERVQLTEADDKRIRRMTDKRILSVIVWVYFLQIFDKSVFGNGKILGMVEDTQQVVSQYTGSVANRHSLTGSDYSLASSLHPIAQLAWQPFSSILLVRVPARYLMAMMVFGWGASQACMAASHNFAGLATTRFFLGLFEGGCLPLFSLLTAQWYRRSEQSIRVATWYGTNGLATIVAGVIAFGFAHVNNASVAPWQLIFVLAGLITVLTVPFIYWLIDSDVSSARFLSQNDKAKAIERLRANQTGTGNNEFKWDQALELVLDVKTYLFLLMEILLGVGAAVTTYFGPTLINNFGFDVYISSLLNIPFGALQLLLILTGCWAAQRCRIKSAVILAMTVPVIIGLALLYRQGKQGYFNQPEALAGYYLIAFLFGINPIFVAWIVANTAGQTKKALMMSVFNAGASAGNIIGPLLFNAKDAPFYLPGCAATLGITVAMTGAVCLQVGWLYILNRQRQRQRVANGKSAKIVDTSMSRTYQTYGESDKSLGQNALLDLTDIKNDEFVYVY